MLIRVEPESGYWLAAATPKKCRLFADLPQNLQLFAAPDVLRENRQIVLNQELHVFDIVGLGSGPTEGFLDDFFRPEARVVENVAERIAGIGYHAVHELGYVRFHD